MDDKKNNRTNSFPRTKATAPRQNDIILGRGKGTQNHPGNMRMRKTLSQYRKQYIEAKHGVKQCVVKEAYHVLVQGDVRFLRLDKEDKWVLVDKETALLKVGHCLRGATKKEQRPQLNPQAQIVTGNRGDEGSSGQHQSDNMGDEGASRQHRSGNMGEEGASRQYQGSLLGEYSTDVLSTLQSPLRNLYGISIPALGSLPQMLSRESIQNQYPAAQHELSGWSSFRIPNVSSRAEFLGAHSRSVPATPGADAIHLALRAEMLKEWQQAQVIGAMLPY
ncbi:unnamed protein product [Cylindrotheca closterium]|uniref:DUF6824 domain-containing protein n=1 Tax=Cylindrotheca closterium TaxID=2856 RepID=A0AAD2FW59_9STRA|nr:unnamed protein product [Cylindrotheca closterium]